MLALQRAQSEERGDIVSVMVLALPCSSDSGQVPLPSGPCMSCQYHGGVGLASRHVPSQDSPQDPGNRTPSWSQGGGEVSLPACRGVRSAYQPVCPADLLPGERWH